MYYATMMMHKPEDHPNDNRDVLVLIKDKPNFKVGYYDAHDGWSVLDDMNEYMTPVADSVEMWCDIPTRETIHKINKL